MTSTSTSTSQFGRAIEAANLTDQSGLYVIRPRWARQRMLLKFGLTTNVNARMYSGYRHSFPIASPGNSFELVGFLRVGGEPQLRRREATMLRATIDGYGFRKPPNDLEWRYFTGDDRTRMNAQLAKLFSKIRTTIDGNWFIFHHETGEILIKGGARPTLQVANILPPVPNVLTRAATKAGLRRTRGVLVMNAYGQMVPHTPGTARRLRNRPPAQK